MATSEIFTEGGEEEEEDGDDEEEEEEGEEEPTKMFLWGRENSAELVRSSQLLRGQSCQLFWEAEMCQISRRRGKNVGLAHSQIWKICKKGKKFKKNKYLRFVIFVFLAMK